MVVYECGESAESHTNLDFCAIFAWGSVCTVYRHMVQAVKRGFPNINKSEIKIQDSIVYCHVKKLIGICLGVCSDRQTQRHIKHLLVQDSISD